MLWRNGQSPKIDSTHARRLIDAVVPTGGRLWVLDVGLVEVVNVVWRYHHRGAASLDDARQMLSFLLAIPVEVVPSQPLLPAAFELAAKYDCAVHDALFVQLSHDHGLPGLTADEPLWKAVHGDYPQIQLLRLWTPPP